jgi:hypothetical protein
VPHPRKQRRIFNEEPDDESNNNSTSMDQWFGTERDRFNLGAVGPIPALVQPPLRNLAAPVFIRARRPPVPVGAPATVPIFTNSQQDIVSSPLIPSQPASDINEESDDPSEQTIIQLDDKTLDTHAIAEVQEAAT